MEFCDYVRADADLISAQVTSFSGYSQWVGVILHRFAVLKVQKARPGESELSLRLDRRTDPESSKMDLILSGGKTSAYDRVSRLCQPGWLRTYHTKSPNYQARMADTTSLLVEETAKLEILLLLREELTLGRVCDILEAIFKSLETYNAKQVRRALILPGTEIDH